MDGHSKLPYFMRMHGSVLPRMIVPITLIGSWATLITCLSELKITRPRKFAESAVPQSKPGDFQVGR